MSTEKTKFELAQPLPAATEKQLELHKKNIRLYTDGVRRSGAQFFGYAFLAGREINLAAELLPHGELLPWIQQNFPAVSEPATRIWRNFSKELESKFVTITNLPTAGLLKNPTKPKKSFSEKECSLITETVNKVMDGKGMMEFMRGCKLLREPKAHTHTPPKPLSPEEITKAELEQAEAVVDALVGDINLILVEQKDVASVLTIVSPKKRKELLDAAVTLNNKLRELEKSK